MENNPKLKAITGSCRFLEAGVVQYENEMVYISPENLMVVAEAHKGRPLIIDHQDLTAANAGKIVVGYVLNIRKNDEDGWAWCDYVCNSAEAIELIKQGWNVSCAYFPSKSGPSGVWHNIPYDREILEATGDHIAIVQKPRYEKAKIIINSIPEIMSEEKTIIEAIIETTKTAFAEGFESLKNALKKNEDEKEEAKENKKMKNEDEKEEKKAKENEADETGKEEEKENKKKYNEADTITVGDDEVTVKELMDCYKSSKKKNSEEEKEEPKKNIKKNHLLNAKESIENGSTLKESEVKHRTLSDAYALGKKLC